MFVRRATYTVAVAMRVAAETAARAAGRDLAAVRAAYDILRRERDTALAEVERLTREAKAHAAVCPWRRVDLELTLDADRPATLGEMRDAATAVGRQMADDTPPGGVTLAPLPDLPAGDRAQLDGYQAASDRIVTGLPCPDCECWCHGSDEYDPADAEPTGGEQ